MLVQIMDSARDGRAIEKTLMDLIRRNDDVRQFSFMTF
jgi:hypothetical protein